MHITGDQQLVKKINKTIVLDTIVARSPLSRAQLAAITGLHKGTVSSLVGELIEEQLVHETGPGHSSGGRKPIMLVFNRAAGFAVGMELGIGYLQAVMTDLAGGIVSEQRFKMSGDLPEEAVALAEEALRTMRTAAPASPHGIVGVGFGVPGIVDRDGVVLLAPNLGWSRVPLGAMLTDRLGLPVTLDNEANAGAIGELQTGAGQQAADLIYLSVGAGIGAGVVIGGELRRGAGGLFGEVGHMTIERGGNPCRCGNTGCWEQYASEQALLERASAIGADSLDRLLELAASGSAEAAGLFAQTGQALGVGIASLINILNPKLVLIGGEMTRAERWVREEIERSIGRRALSQHRKQTAIRFAALGTRSAVLGAAHLALAAYFDKDRVTV